MLVLTRKAQEVVVIGGADGLELLLKVTVLGIQNGKVRLGFEAPESVSVHRLEVWDRIQASNQLHHVADRAPVIPAAYEPILAARSRENPRLGLPCNSDL